MPYEGKPQEDDLWINLIVFRLKLPEEQDNAGEVEILLKEPSSPLFKLKQPQPQISSTETVVPQIATKSEVNDWWLSTKEFKIYLYPQIIF